MTAGIAIGFVVFFLFMAAASRPLRALSFDRGHAVDEQRTPRLVRLFERISLQRPGLVVALGLAVLVVSVAGALRMTAESRVASYFWPQSEVYEGLEFIDQEMGGTTWLELVMTSGEGGYFKTDQGLKAMETAEAYFDDVPATGNIMSLVSLRNEMRKVFRPEWFPELSDSALLRAVSIGASDLVRQTTNREFTQTRITVRIRETAPGLNRQAVLHGLRAHLAAHAAELEDVEIEVTGIFPVYNEMLQQLMVGQKESILVVTVAVFVMLLLLFRSPVMALLVLLPQALPAAVVLGVMGWVGMPLDLVTVMIAAIAVGVGIDAAIQYAMRFRLEVEATGDHREALRRAHGTIGRAIWIATSIIIAGFSILVLSSFFPMVWFGLFTALAMLIGQLATLTMLPSLFLVTGYPRKRAGLGARVSPPARETIQR
jgi:predicted RND superfamily exporter protein